MNRRILTTRPFTRLPPNETRSDLPEKQTSSVYAKFVERGGMNRWPDPCPAKTVPIAMKTGSLASKDLQRSELWPLFSRGPMSWRWKNPSLQWSSCDAYLVGYAHPKPFIYFTGERKTRFALRPTDYFGAFQRFRKYVMFHFFFMPMHRAREQRRNTPRACASHEPWDTKKKIVTHPVPA